MTTAATKKKTAPVKAKDWHYFEMRLDPEQLKRIDDYRWANRISSRMEAIRVLIERGLMHK
jgi:hypothetical protein